jgi:ATP-dependent helicase/nuclease subunit A
MTAVLKKPHPHAPDPRVVQRTAADPGASIWVGASAGSGKTTVLVERVLRLLLAGTPPQKILCLTFTRAAAAEMENRVTAALGRWAVCSDHELRTALDDLQNRAPEPAQLITARRLFARALSCPGGMRIGTIHAFGQEILRRFPIEAGLPPHFAVIEEGDARVRQDEARADVLRAASREPESDQGRALRLLVRDLGEHGFEEAMNAVLNERARLASSIAKAGNLENLITQTRTLFKLAPGDTEEKFCREAVNDRILPRKDLLHAARFLLEGGKTCAARGQKMLDWLALSIEERVASLEVWLDCFFKSDGDFYQSYADKKLQTQHPDLEPLMRREAARLQSVKERIDAARTAESTAAILTLGAELIHRYGARKAAQALLDYDDLIIRANELLHRPGIAPWVLYKLDGGLDHILVDEAQDTSRAQWSIIAALAEEFFSGLGTRPDQNRTLFVVGDEKQSIFSFQHADPDAFAEMRGFFAQRIGEAEKSYKEVPLHMSFRSAPAILRAVDAVFADDHARAGVSLDKVEHFPARDDQAGRVELWPLIPAAEKDKHSDEWVLPLDYETERDPQAELAAQIAARIKTWLDKKEKLPGHAQPVAPGDVMILLRRRGRFADLMVRALKQLDVPVTGVDRMKLAKQLAVMDLCALMQFALLPEDDLNLATVLRGPLLGLSEEQLMELAIGRKATLWQSLKDNAGFIAARDYLQKWLAEADFTTPFAMLAHRLNAPCPGSAISGRQALWARLGPDALDPIDELLNAAQEFSHRHAPSLQSFLHWLLVSDSEIKRELDRGGGPNGGQVRIMTVHAAKGLEAPIVFLPDTANVPRAREMPKLLWSDEGVPLYLARRPQVSTARTVWDRARQKQMEEYRRLLYVALTRAADRLYIGGWATNRNEGESFEESWYALARRGLQNLHEPMTAGEDVPAADIVFADHILPKIEKESATKKPSARKIALPDWGYEPAPTESVAPRPLAPSRMAAEAEPPIASPDILFTRGRIIHRLLESLPDVEDARRDSVAAKFLANPQHRLTKDAQKEIAAEVLGLLRNPDYAPLFGSDSRAEVPLAGYIGNQPVAGQIDRLCVRKDGIWIIDYKSNRPPPARAEDVSKSYIQQLAAYRTVLAEIYPNTPIRCFLLWTYGAKLMEIAINHM